MQVAASGVYHSTDQIDGLASSALSSVPQLREVPAPFPSNSKPSRKRNLDGLLTYGCASSPFALPWIAKPIALC